MIDTVLHRARHAAHLAQTYVALTGESRRQAPLFEGVEVFCAFIGYSRSGHSIVAAVLDAHPNAVIAHEQGAVQYVHARFDRDRLFALLLRNTQTIGHTKGHSGRRRGGYTYDVPGQWQGRFERVRVIGDKHGEDTTCRLDADPALMDRLQRTAGVPVRYVHVIRNPFDNIATMARRRAQRRGRTSADAIDLTAATDRYFFLCDANVRIKARLDDAAVYDLRHEQFVREPAAELRALCHWLGLDPRPDYIEAAAGIVFDAPHRSRDLVEWPPVLRERIERGIDAVPFLTGYSFASP